MTNLQGSGHLKSNKQYNDNSENSSEDFMTNNAPKTKQNPFLIYNGLSLVCIIDWSVLYQGHSSLNFKQMTE